MNNLRYWVPLASVVFLCVYKGRFVLQRMSFAKLNFFKASQDSQSRNVAEDEFLEKIAEGQEQLDQYAKELAEVNKELCETTEELNDLKTRTADIFQDFRAKKDKIHHATIAAKRSLISLFRGIVPLGRDMNLLSLQEIEKNSLVFTKLEDISWIKEDGAMPEDLSSIALFQSIVGDFVATNILAKGRECCGICFERGLPTLLERLDSAKDEISEDTAAFLERCTMQFDSSDGEWGNPEGLLSLFVELTNVTSHLTRLEDSSWQEQSLQQFVQKAVRLSVELYRLNIRLEPLGKDYINRGYRMHHLVSATTTSLEDGTESDEQHQHLVTFVRQPGFRTRSLRNDKDSVEIWLQPDVLVKVVTEEPSHIMAPKMQLRSSRRTAEMPVTKKVRTHSSDGHVEEDESML